MNRHPDPANDIATDIANDTPARPHAAPGNRAPPAAAAGAWQAVQRFRVADSAYGRHIVAAERYLWLRSVAGHGRLVMLHAVAPGDASLPKCELYRAMWASAPPR